ncbi:MAG: DUF2147 domain-containing protein [Prevotellaceae bacterium]|jgi:uncharacterized protein (DUF2147 family)|nr:DUF2147 domain-containing protein [Prevotellaceae bacterium]
MKKYIIILLSIFCAINISAQENADKIIGYYYSIDPFSGEESQNEIYPAKDGTYEGRVVWVKNKKFQNQVNLVFLKGLKFNEKENEWQNGVLVYPGKSGTFKTYMSFDGKNRLKVRGYWGVSLFGKTIYWTKEEKLRE